MPKHRRFMQADVFCDIPAKGNGLAIVFDADDLSSQDMQAFAAWTNLAETTFLLTPTDPAADYRVRIFTPLREMPFAGHPTLGSCAAWLHAGHRPKTGAIARQECAIGLVEIDLSGPVPAFAAPATSAAPMQDTDQTRLTDAMGITRSQIKQTVVLDNGPVWQLFELHDPQHVLAVDAMRTRFPDHAGLALLAQYPPGSPIQYETRNIAPSSGMQEDPITGSLNAAIAVWLNQTGRWPDHAIAAQGTCLNRPGRVTYRKDPQKPGTIWIGGAANILIDGTLWL